jgi:hypothetical protein
MIMIRSEWHCLQKSDKPSRLEKKGREKMNESKQTADGKLDRRECRTVMYSYWPQCSAMRVFQPSIYNVQAHFLPLS